MDGGDGTEAGALSQPSTHSGGGGGENGPITECRGSSDSVRSNRRRRNTVQHQPCKSYTTAAQITGNQLMSIFISPEAAQRKRILTLKNNNKNTNNRINSYCHLKELLKKTRRLTEKKNKIE